MLLKINGLPDSVIDTFKQGSSDVHKELAEFGSDYIHMVTHPSIHAVSETVKSAFDVHVHTLANTCDLAVATGRTVVHTGLELLQFVF